MKTEPTPFSVVLAAGLGQRLLPATRTLPKPLIVARGRPCIDWILASLLKAGTKRNYVVVGHLAHVIRRHLREPHFASSGVQFAEQSRQTGTASAIACCEPLLREDSRSEGPMIVTAADYIVPEDFFSLLLERYRSQKPDVLIATRRLPACSARSKNVVLTRSDGTVSAILEKPATLPDGIVLSAPLIFVAPKELVRQCCATQPSIRGEMEVQETLNAMIQNGWRALTFETEQVEDLESLA